jgi:hypothetical protein
MNTIHIDIAGARQVGLRFETFPDALYEDLRKEVDALSVELLARIEAATPSRSGALRSQERLRLFTDKTRITGYVDIAAGSDSYAYAKAGTLEYGAGPGGRRNPAKVASHEMRLDHHWSAKLDAPETVIVKAHSRPVNIAEVAFERGPLAAMQPEITSRLNAVVERASLQANNGQASA